MTAGSVLFSGAGGFLVGKGRVSFLSRFQGMADGWKSREALINSQSQIS
jgi:hypothetical protein